MLASGGYELLKKRGVEENKSIFFVKGTDSLHRAFNDYLKIKEQKKTHLSIEFGEDSGTIYIPTIGNGLSSGDEKRVAQFKFDVDSNVAMQGQQGRFECIQYKNGSKKLVKYGVLTKRLRIHASEDVYEKTKNRIAAIELEQRNNCTQEIDLNLHSVNRKVRIDRAVGSITDCRKNQTGGKLTKVKSKPLPKTCNPSLMKRPLKERIIHMLAVRPYRKIELSAALRRDGLKESDKNHLMFTLTSVATLKDNVYRLLRHVWNDIDEDWPFYSDMERQQMKRNKPQNLTPPLSDSGISVGSNQSPSNSMINGGDKSPSCQYKRPGYYSGADGFQTKRQRISHYNKKTSFSSSVGNVNPTFKASVTVSGNEENIDQISPSRVTNCFDEIIEKSGLSVTAAKNTPLQTNLRRNLNPVTSIVSSGAAGTITGKSQSWDAFSGKRLSNATHKRDVDFAKRKVNVTKSDADSTTDMDKLGLNNRKHLAEPNGPVTDVSRSPLPVMTDLRLLGDCAVSYSNDSPAWNELPDDYKKRYVTITSLEQRRKYKFDFLQFFGEYQELAKEVMAVTQVFTQLGEELKNHEKGTKEYQIIEAEIKKRYDLANAVKYKETKRKFHQLHDMLSYIKNLVEEYDEKFY